MKKSSTLIFLVNQFNPEFSESSLVGPTDDHFGTEVQESPALFAPPQRLVNAILGYARSLEVADTGSAGKVEWILN